MAWYKYEQYIHRENTTAYDVIHMPDQQVPHSGIYRCAKCGHEIALRKGETFPELPHPQHTDSDRPAEWKLLVFAQHNYE